MVPKPVVGAVGAGKMVSTGGVGPEVVVVAAETCALTTLLTRADVAELVLSPTKPDVFLAITRTPSVCAVTMQYTY